MAPIYLQCHYAGQGIHPLTISLLFPSYLPMNPSTLLSLSIPLPLVLGSPSSAGLSLHPLPISSFSYSEGGGEPSHVNVSDSHVCSLAPLSLVPSERTLLLSPQEAPFLLASYQGL